MELQITGKNIELTPVVREYVERKLGKLNQRVPKITGLKVEITQEKTKSPRQQLVVRVTVAGAGTRFHSEERGSDLFQAVDRAAAKMKRQLADNKGKRYNRGRVTSFARGELQADESSLKSLKVVKVKRFIVKPMSPSTAIAQMEILGHDFFLFFNAEAAEVQLLYRRRDGNYGLIEPELE